MNFLKKKKKKKAIGRYSVPTVSTKRAHTHKHRKTLANISSCDEVELPHGLCFYGNSRSPQESLVFFQLLSFGHSWGLLIEETVWAGLCVLVFSKDRRSPHNLPLCLGLWSHSHLRTWNELSLLQFFSSPSVTCRFVGRGETTCGVDFCAELRSQPDWSMASERTPSADIEQFMYIPPVLQSSWQQRCHNSCSNTI